MATKKAILAPLFLHLYEGKEVVTTQRIGPYVIKGNTVRRSVKQYPLLNIIHHVLLYLGQQSVIRTIHNDSIIISPTDPTGKSLNYPNEDIKPEFQTDDANYIEYNHNKYNLRRYVSINIENSSFILSYHSYYFPLNSMTGDNILYQMLKLHQQCRR
jgi:hypothetical protein